MKKIYQYKENSICRQGESVSLKKCQKCEFYSSNHIKAKTLRIICSNCSNITKNQVAKKTENRTYDPFRECYVDEYQHPHLQSNEIEENCEYI